MTPPKPQGREDLAKEIRKIYEDSPTFSEAYRNIADFIIKRDKSRDQALSYVEDALSRAAFYVGNMADETRSSGVQNDYDKICHALSKIRDYQKGGA